MRLFIFVLFAPLTFLQYARAQNTELSCMHVFPIQMRYLERHVNYTKLTPELEKHTIDQFMKRIDGSKIFMLKKDIKDIEASMHGIFEKTRNLDCGPMLKANEIFVKRVEEQLAFAKKYLAADFKLDPKTTVQSDPKDRVRATDTKQAQTIFAKQLQFDVANYVATDISLDDAKKHVLQNYERFLKHYRDFKNRDIFSNYLDSFATALDPHSNYLSADNLEEFEIQMRLSLDGIGATLSQLNGFTVVEALVPGGAAQLAGQLKAKDKIIAVGQGQDGPYTDVMEMELREVIRLIRGPKGTAVRLKVIRKVAKESQRLEITIVRDKIKLEEQGASILYVDREVGGQKLKLGLLNLPSFYHDERPDGPSAATDLKKLLADAVKNKADAIVLDLSNNGGGSLPDAVDVAGLFIATGNVVSLGQRATKAGGPLAFDTLSDHDATVDWSGPLVILTNRGSASASEIVSGALQDYNRALIVGGDHTFGKGTLQAVEQLRPGLGASKTTTGMFFTAGGQSTQHRGVSGDIVFPSILSQDSVSEKKLDYSLPPKKIPDFTSASAFVREGPSAWTPLNKEIIAKVKSKAKPRIEASTEFKKILGDLKKSKTPEKTISVSSILKGKEPKATGKADDEEEKVVPILSKEEKRKKYLERADVQEALNVAADLIGELNTEKSRASSSRHPTSH